MGSTIKIITAGDANYRQMIDGAVRMNSCCGHDTLVYDIGGLGIGQPFDISPDLEMVASPSIMFTGPLITKSTFKPRIILDALQRHIDDACHFAWIDGDAFCIHPIDDVFEMDFDMAVTMRRSGEGISITWPPVYDRYVNAGVLFFKNTPALRLFLEKWIHQIPMTTTATDQEALNTLLLPYVDFSVTGRIYNAHDLNVLVLTTDEFNFYYFPETPPPTTRILHFKGDKSYSMKWFEMYMKPVPVISGAIKVA